MFSQSNSNKSSTTLVLAIIAALVLALPAHAQKNKQEAQPQSPDKLDVTDLEKKYWAAKDTDFSVVQNRTYAKEGRFALTAQYGTLVNDAYSEGPVYNAGLNYYFTERHGLEFTYQKANLSDSRATENYKNLSGAVQADFNRFISYYGVSYNWVPVYAKVSLLNKKIIYFDMAISPGVGQLTYEAQMEAAYPDVKKSTTAVSLDVTQTFFLSRSLALRIDYKNKWYQEKILKSSGLFTHGQELKTGTANTTTLTFGVQLFF
jgi:outer membrane beta-barrel protein